MRKRLDKFTRLAVLVAFLQLLAVDIFSLDMAALNGVWTGNIMSVGNAARERDFSWGKGKTVAYAMFFDVKEGVVGMPEEGLFEIKDLKQEDANTISMTILRDPKKDQSNSFDDGVKSYFIRVHFENYNKIWLEMPAAYWNQGKNNPLYRISGPPREMAGADFEPIESVFGERAGDFCYTVENGKVTVTRYLDKAAGKAEVPPAINGMPVKTIGYGAFAGCFNLKSVNMPRGVTRIEDYGFAGTGLASVVIPDGVVSIGDSAFLDCAALTSIVIPESVTYIGLNAFENCVNLTSIVIPESVTEIGPGAFANCANLKSVVLPDSITAIKSGTFAGCSSMETITLPESIAEIDPRAFSYCSSLRSIVLPSSLSGIWAEAFSHCSSLMSIELPSDLSYIGPGAFQNCSGLKTITIPQGVRQIEPNMFRGCDNLISVKLFRRTRIKLEAIMGTPAWTVNEDFMKRVKIEYMN